MIKNIYICGNPIVDNDSMPFKILEGLKANLPEINFIEFDPTENFPDDTHEAKRSAPIYFIDTVLGIKDVTEFDDIDDFELSPHLSVHDADLSLHLNLLRKIGKLPSVKIFGVPDMGDEKRILEQLIEKIQALPRS